jgi:hypothetical protein
MVADKNQNLATNFANERESIQEKKREADLRAERLASGACNALGWPPAGAVWSEATEIKANSWPGFLI